jgi:hypothetical protein
VRRALTLTPGYALTPHQPGSQWRQDLRKWLSSPDPSTNHVILRGAQHQGTANWFFRGSLLEEWKSTGSLLWIHGKRASFEFSFPLSDVTCLCSGLWEKRPVVRSFSCVRSRDLNYASSAVIQDILTLREAGLASMAYSPKLNSFPSFSTFCSFRSLLLYTPSHICDSRQRRSQAN